MQTEKRNMLQELINQYATKWHALTPGQRIHIVDFIKAKVTEYQEADPDQMFFKLFYPIHMQRGISNVTQYNDAQLTQALVILVNVLTDYDDILINDPEPSWAETWFYHNIPEGLLGTICHDLDWPCN